MTTAIKRLCEAACPIEQYLPSSDWDVLGIDDDMLHEVSVYSNNSIRGEDLNDDSAPLPDDMSALSDPFSEWGMDLDDGDDDEVCFFGSPPAASDGGIMYCDPSSLPFAKRFEVTRQNLEASMRRSQRTRPSLSLLTTTQVETYGRQISVKDVIESVKKSSLRLQVCLTAGGGAQMTPAVRPSVDRDVSHA